MTNIEPNQEVLECKLSNILKAQTSCRCKALKTTVIAAAILAVASGMYTAYEPLTALFDNSTRQTAQTHLRYTALGMALGGLGLWLYPTFSRRCNRRSEQLVEEELATRAELYLANEYEYNSNDQPAVKEVRELEYELREIKKQKTVHEQNAITTSRLLAGSFATSFLVFTFSGDLAAFFHYQDLPLLATSIKSATAASVFGFGLLLLHNILFGFRQQKYEGLLEAETQARYRLALAMEMPPTDA